MNAPRARSRCFFSGHKPPLFWAPHTYPIVGRIPLRAIGVLYSTADSEMGYAVRFLFGGRYKFRTVPKMLIKSDSYSTNSKKGPRGNLSPRRRVYSFTL